MVPAVDDVAVHLQNGVANLDPAVPKGVALRVEAANLDAHLGPVLVSREADAEAAGTLVDADVDERATKPAVLSLDLVSSVPVVVLVVIGRPPARVVPRVEPGELLPLVWVILAGSSNKVM